LALRPFAATPPVDLIRLIPITAAEAAFARQNGWQQLEALLARPDVDCRDLFRQTVV
jgi:hypothetical protein